MMKKLNGTTALVLVVVAGVLVVGVGWFVLISPQRSKASDLDAKIGSTQSQLAADQHILAVYHPKQARAELKAGVQALPDQAQMSQILRQVSAAIAASKTQFSELVPQPLVPGADGTQVLAMNLVVNGRYFALQKLLKLLRSSAELNAKGKITGHGRLYTVDGIQFAQAGTGVSSGQLQGTITLNAFVYTPNAAPSTTTTTPTDTTASAAAAPTN